MNSLSKLLIIPLLVILSSCTHRKIVSGDGPLQSDPTVNPCLNLPNAEMEICELSKNRYTGQMITWRNSRVTLREALTELARFAHLNIVSNANLDVEVYINFEDVRWDQALDILLRTNKLDKYQEGTVIVIGPVDELRRARETHCERK